MRLLTGISRLAVSTSRHISGNTSCQTRQMNILSQCRAVLPATVCCSKSGSQGWGVSRDARVTPVRTAQTLGSGDMSKYRERTFIAIKPDGVQRGLIGNIIKRFEQKGFKLVAVKMVKPENALLQEHYQNLKGKPFFPAVLKYMSSGPVVAMIWEGLNVVQSGRTILGETNPFNSKPGTVRGDFSIETGRNICHGSDSEESATREIALWFKEDEIHDYVSCAQSWIYEDA